MNWYYAESGQQRGPIDTAELTRLVALGVIRAETLVWNPTLTNWQPWASVAASVVPAVQPAPAPVPEADGRIRCSACQQLFAPADTIEITGQRVCSQCKPIVLQQLQEGLIPVTSAAPAGTETGVLSEAELLARDYTVDATGALAEAWELLFRRPAVVWLGCLLVWAAFIGATMALSLLQLIPIVGIVFGAASTLLGGAVEAGQANLYLRERRGLQNEVTHGFAVVGPRFWDILWTSLPQTVGMFLVLLVVAVVGVTSMMGGMAFAPGRLAGVGALTIGLIAAGGFVFAVGFTYLQVSLRYAPILVLDKGYRWWPAICLSWRFVRKHFWQHLWLSILGGIVMFAGACACLIGGLVTYPLAYGMLPMIYDRNFRDLAPARR